MRYLALVLAFLLTSPVKADVRGFNSDLLSTWYACAVTIMTDARTTMPNQWVLPLTYKKHSVRKDAPFLTLMHAVIHKETQFQPNLISSAKAYGLMQVTEVAMREAARHCEIPVVPMKKLLDVATNIRYGSCYLDFALMTTKGDVDRALILYNGGYRQLEKYDRGYGIATETANYVLGVRRALNLCKMPTDIQYYAH